MQGRILSCSAGVYRVETENSIIECSARGAFRNDGIVPVAGDYVEVIPDAKDSSQGVINTLLPRKNCLIRPGVSNVDVLFIVFALHDPEPNLFSIDKLTSIAEHNDISAHIVFNKCDLADGEEIEKITSIYRSCGYETHALSAGSNPDEIREVLGKYVENKTCVFTGPSGVGKSTIINALYPSMPRLETGSISQKTRRGRHTTRTTVLYKDAEGHGGYLVDTPGFSLLDFERFRFMKKEELVYSFPEYAPLALSCKYTKCTHTKEEGCAILEKVNSGKFPLSRHESYIALWEDLKKHHDWDEKNQKNY